MNKTKIKERLFVTPIFNQNEFFDASSINVRLGNEFIVMRKQSFPLLDISNSTSKDKIRKYQEKIRIGFREQFVLHPRQLIIGSTLEYISVPCKLMCYVIGKSSWGRMGLIIATATKVDPGFKGCITLEIINEGEVPIVLYPGIPIAQLVFHETSSKENYNGKYYCPTGPQFPNFEKNIEDWKFWFPKN
ncbi:MAG: dCTP deaminase [Acidobacteria bacterium]|nr:dCTP deaminase [Acidobacteriota bacterium]MBU4307564.1 dCTP deaminase [Acidobacteriota bacterium]MCG2811067.1 dCTP deaminase [Candidatus Aminicenantes bacterium]